jgi:N6-L-threonylcarbamoyladenine synthase
LVGSLLVGTLAARTLAELHNKPLYPVHHVEGHVYANFITEQAPSSKLALPSQQPKFPMLALAVSGLHSQLILFEDHGKYRLLGETLDDAVGEAFDKVARMLGLPYPGGPSIAKAAEAGDPLAYRLPTAKLKHPYDFSFSGLKTAVLRAIQREVGVDHNFPSFELPARLNDVQRANFAASFQYTAVKTLVNATIKAAAEYSPASVVIAGGVAANQELRRQLAEKLSLPIEYAPIQLCTDNGAMIAALGYYKAQAVDPTPVDTVSVYPSLSMRDTVWVS